MDNKKRTLIVDTFDDLISMNGDVYDTQKLTVKYASCKFSAEYVRDILSQRCIILNGLRFRILMANFVQLTACCIQETVNCFISAPARERGL